jgi:hypothetical protein
MNEEILLYKIKCPKCSAKADAVMTKSGIKGTYREPTANFIAKRIECKKCGLIRDKLDNKNLDFELWYKTDFKGHSLWAVNENHLDFLIGWLNGKMNSKDLGYIERAYAETLPKWIVTNKKKSRRRPWTLCAGQPDVAIKL